MLALTKPLYSNYFASKYHVQFQNLNTIKVYFVMNSETGSVQIACFSLSLFNF